MVAAFDVIGHCVSGFGRVALSKGFEDAAVALDSLL